MPKKKWNKPKLIVLFKAKPDEALMGGCKSHVESGAGGPVSGHRDCAAWPCEACYGHSPS